jgi:hypothetical protein
MTISVRLDPNLEALVGAEAQRRGVTKSAVIEDALERTFGRKNPAELLRAVRSGAPMGDPDASENVSAKIRAKLNAQRSD